MKHPELLKKKEQNMKTVIKAKVEKGSSVESMETRCDVSLKDMTIGQVLALKNALKTYSQFSSVGNDLYISLKFAIQCLHHLQNS